MDKLFNIAKIRHLQTTTRLTIKVKQFTAFKTIRITPYLNSGKYGGQNFVKLLRKDVYDKNKVLLKS